MLFVVNGLGFKPGVLGVIFAVGGASSIFGALGAERTAGALGTGMAIAGFSREAGDAATALQYAELAAKIVPDDPAIKKLISDLRRQVPPR